MTTSKGRAKSFVRGIGRLARNTVSRREWAAMGIHPPINRQILLSKISGCNRALEIGPFDKPLLRGNHVSYFDVLCTQGLRQRALEYGRDPSKVPPIDYVSEIGDLNSIHDSFDAILSCHSIEHQPDLIAHLKGVQRLLQPEGKYFLVLPDKRFTFDHYVPETTVADVLTAHSERRTVHTPHAVTAHFLQTTHNIPFRHWLGLHGVPTTTEPYKAAAAIASDSAAAGQYVDVHAWIFSPKRFYEIMTALRHQGLVGLKGIDVYETEFLEGEFFSVLTF